MKTRFAFAGFRHAHILDLLAGVEERGDAQVVASCEEDAAMRASLGVTITHTDFAKMLSEVECDVIAIGDYYSRRGALAIAALEAGRHVLSDKPLCTTLEEQTTIERLAAERSLLVGLQLDTRDFAAFRTLREVIVSGAIGEVCTVRIQGQHPLLLGTRPAWYFEPGKHGGTINDIGIHAFDFIPWLTGLDWRKIDAARAWNGKARAFPHFHDCAQFMATLNNGAGVLADFSYLAPDRLGYKLPHYWHVLIHGTSGLAEAHLQAEHITVITDTSAIPEIRPVLEKRTRGYLDDFLRELRGESPALTSAQSLRASRLALEAQKLADSD
ncbi:MAG: Gfo/Idh/MocA family oxidoreductase [Chthoniobacteraceae bacterium]